MLQDHAAAPSRWEVESRLIQKALHDDDFRRDLMFRSKEVIERELGDGLPDDVAVVVLTEKPNEMILVVPWAGHAALGSIDEPGEPQAEPLRGLYARAAARAARDQAWRDQLKRNPASVYPDAHRPREARKLKVRVIEENERVVQIAIPHPSRAELR